MIRHPPPYPRDLRGYGRTPPHPRWPGDARVELQFVLDCEEGGEQFLFEMANPPSYADRHLSMKSIYEYGSRAGMALERPPSWRARSLNLATRSRATAGAGSTTSRSTRRQSACP